MIEHAKQWYVHEATPTGRIRYRRKTIYHSYIREHWWHGTSHQVREEEVVVLEIEIQERKTWAFIKPTNEDHAVLHTVWREAAITDLLHPAFFWLLSSPKVRQDD